MTRLQYVPMAESSLVCTLSTCLYTQLYSCYCTIHKLAATIKLMRNSIINVESRKQIEKQEVIFFILQMD